METPTGVDAFLVILAIVILGGGLLMLLSGVRRLGDKS